MGLFRPTHRYAPYVRRNAKTNAMDNTINKAVMSLTEDFLDKFDFYMFRCKSPVTFGQMMKAHHALKKKLKELQK